METIKYLSASNLPESVSAEEAKSIQTPQQLRILWNRRSLNQAKVDDLKRAQFETAREDIAQIEGLLERTPPANYEKDPVTGKFEPRVRVNIPGSDVVRVFDPPTLRFIKEVEVRVYEQIRPGRPSTRAQPVGKR